MPISDDLEDIEYTDMLLEYQEIQKQLASIQEEERTLVSGDTAGIVPLRYVTAQTYKSCEGCLQLKPN